MFRRFVAAPAAVALAVGLASCGSPAASLALHPGHPATPDAPHSPAAPLADLAPVAQPDLPAALRPEPAADHGAARHGATGQITADHRAAPSAPADAAHPDANTLRAAVDAYLAVQEALAADRLDAPAAARLADGLRQSAETAPAEDPHLWHRMSAEVAAAQTAADALRQSQTLAQARVAFGALGVPFAALVEAAGAGAGLERHTCGMTDAPGGGVWLQRAGPPQNPYFGTGMLMCSRRAEPVEVDR